jgi:hypothetical protein
MSRDDSSDFQSFMKAFGVQPDRVQRAVVRAGKTLAVARAKPDKPTRAQDHRARSRAALADAARDARESKKTG